MSTTEINLKYKDLKREKAGKKKQLSDKNNPTLSLCMIVKDEEYFLPCAWIVSKTTLMK